MIDPIQPYQLGTRRERRIQRTRKTIMDAAAKLFAQKGYKATTTKDIAQVADIGESTLYGYFSSKLEILQAILTQQAEMVDSLLVRFSKLEDHRSIVNLVDLLMEEILAEVVYNRVLIAEAWTDDDILQGFVIKRWLPVMEILQQLIASSTAAGIFRPIDPDLGARMIIAFFLGSILPILRGIEPPLSPERRYQLAETIVDFISNGFNAQKG
jgi:AcrR family transcriptional regulator